MARSKRAVGATTQLHLRLPPLEKAVIEKEAKKAALTVSEYIRRRALGIRIVSRMDDHVINELRRLGGLQKLLASEIPSREAEYNVIVRNIVAAINRIR